MTSRWLFLMGALGCTAATAACAPGLDEDLAGGGDSVPVRPANIDTPVVADALVATQTGKLLASDGLFQDSFGWAVALDGDTALVTAIFGDSPSVANTGAAYVFVKSGAAWTEQAKLTADDGEAGAQFGSLAIDGDTAIIGAPRAAIGGFTEVGAAYVFARSGSTWSFVQKLTASDGGSGEQFGRRVAVEGDTAILTAYNATVDGAFGAGAAYVFSRSGGVWSEDAKLTASDVATSDNFGASVALEGDTLIVGQEAVGKGVADVFARSGGVWSPQAQLHASDGSNQDRFGFSVALSGDTAVIGSHRADPGGVIDGGKAYVFERSGSAWTEAAQLSAMDPAAMDFFGWAVGLSGDVALVGAYYGGEGDTGVVHAFERSGGVWTEHATIVGDDTVPNDAFGSAIALDGTTALVGGPGHDEGGAQTIGAAYFFDVVQVPPQANGATCSGNGGCASGFCVDGVCCDSACSAGECDACSVAAGAVIDGECALLTGPPCDDDDLCTQGDACSAGACTGAVVDCVAPAACQLPGVCDPATGTCSFANQPDGTACDDEDLCTTEDACQDGACAGSPLVCTPVDSCHDSGTCDPASGECSSPPKFDGALCAGGTCEAGECVPSNPSGTGGSGAGGDSGGSGTGGDVPFEEGPQGCSCDLSARSPSGAAAWLATALVGLLRRRRPARRERRD